MIRHFHITNPDTHVEKAIRQKIDHLNKPKGSLGMLEKLALQIALIQQTDKPVLRHPCHLMLGADHGVERENVSISPRDVTWQQMINFTRGGAAVNMFCRQHGFELMIIDMGVDHDLTGVPGIINHKIALGTANFKIEPAMTPSQAKQCIRCGEQFVDQCHEKGCNIISIGEMGIANTSAAAAWMHLLTHLPLKQCVGAGAGLNEEGIRHKLEVIEESVNCFNQKKDSLWPNTPYELQVLYWFGGFEMVTAVGAMLRAAELQMIILVDGFIMTACMLMAHALYPQTTAYAIFGHQGDEAGHRLMLEALHASPLLKLRLRLGEGTGALCAFPLVDSAVRMLNEMDNFEHAGIIKYF